MAAPSVRAAIGEAFGFAPGTSKEKEAVAALRRLGFNYVFDTQLAADLTMTGAELARKLGVTEGYGRKLRRRLADPDRPSEGVPDRPQDRESSGAEDRMEDRP